MFVMGVYARLIPSAAIGPRPSISPEAAAIPNRDGGVGFALMIPPLAKEPATNGGREPAAPARGVDGNASPRAGILRTENKSCTSVESAFAGLGGSLALSRIL